MDELLLFWEEKDLYVESATRSQLPLSRVSENITVVTAREIEELNAHSVAEALNRVTGLFVGFQGQDFLSPSSLKIQGADERHALLLIDGVPSNYLSDNHAETLTIPVGIIDRIEVVKGPGSSTWGSSLGGVVNIITKDPGGSFGATALASYGEHETKDYSAQVTGPAGHLNYFLHASHRDSGGLGFHRWSRQDSAYGKARLSVDRDLVLTLTAGHSDTDLKLLEIPEPQVSQMGSMRPTFGTVSLDASLADGLSLSVSGFARRARYETWVEDTRTGDSLLNRTGNDRIFGGSGKVVWTTPAQTVVLGADFSRGTWEERNDPSFEAKAKVIKRAVFANDTVTVGSFTFAPGYRYDRNSISGAFHSPSLGATYRVAERTVLRASVARGFSYPPLIATALGDGAFLQPNPDLKPEKVWSYQAGGETDVGGCLWLKATAFYHRQTDAIERVWDALGPLKDQMRNVGKIDTRGLELDAETAPVRNFSLKAGAAYVHLGPVPEAITTGKFSYTLALKYDDRSSWKGQLSGVFKRWLVEPESTARANGAIWDLIVQRKVFADTRGTMHLLLAGHNLFNASAYGDDLFPNPRRWVEAGVRFSY